LKIFGKRATLAVGRAAAVRLAYGYCEGVKLIEELGVVSRGIRGEGPAREMDERIIALTIMTGCGR
jgi:hypothetical protein